MFVIYFIYSVLNIAWYVDSMEKASAKYDSKEEFNMYKGQYRFDAILGLIGRNIALGLIFLIAGACFFGILIAGE